MPGKLLCSHKKWFIGCFHQFTPIIIDHGMENDYFWNDDYVVLVVVDVDATGGGGWYWITIYFLPPFTPSCGVFVSVCLFYFRCRKFNNDGQQNQHRGDYVKSDWWLLFADSNQLQTTVWDVLKGTMYEQHRAEVLAICKWRQKRAYAMQTSRNFVSLLAGAIAEWYITVPVADSCQICSVVLVELWTGLFEIFLGWTTIHNSSTYKSIPCLIQPKQAIIQNRYFYH